jgi:hypothetical protein
MKTLFIILLTMHDQFGTHAVAAFEHEEVCKPIAAVMSESAGARRGMWWTCDRVRVER